MEKESLFMGKKCVKVVLKREKKFQKAQRIPSGLLEYESA